MSQEKTFAVYIMANQSHMSTYIGLTSDLPARVQQHRDAIVGGFTKAYRTKKLDYYEAIEDAYAALEREKQIKRWRRERKIALIKSMNPTWRDLATDLGLAPLPPSWEQPSTQAGPQAPPLS